MKTAEKCDRYLVISIYGGGHRYYCPTCDIRLNGFFSIISWTNGNPPKNRKCNKNAT